MWQRWNGSSHVFEKSDDNGSSWAPLPLSALTITEGLIADARIPLTIPRLSGPNVFLYGLTSQGNDPGNSFVCVRNQLSANPSGYRITAGAVGLSQDGFTILHAGNNAILFTMSPVGALTPAGIITAPAGIGTIRGSYSAAHTAWTSFFLMDSTDQVALYLVRVGIGTSSNDAVNYGAFATVAVEGTSARIVGNDTSTVQIQLAGLYIQARQSSGGTANVKWVVLKIV
jgi:hypothetical protein